MAPTPRKLEAKRAAEGGKISNLQHGVCAPLTRACHSLLSSFGQLHLNVHFTEINPDPDMPSRETNGFDPCVFPQENSCLPFLAMKTHAIFTLEMNERSGLSPASRTLHSSTVADSPAAASSERAREPIPALASRRLWAKVAELGEARRERCPHTAITWKRRGCGGWENFKPSARRLRTAH